MSNILKSTYNLNVNRCACHLCFEDSETCQTEIRVKLKTLVAIKMRTCICRQCNLQLALSLRNVARTDYAATSPFVSCWRQTFEMLCIAGLSGRSERDALQQTTSTTEAPSIRDIATKIRFHDAAATVGLMSEGNYWVTMVGERTELECRVRARSHTLPGGKRKWRIDISLKQWFPDFFWSRTICGYRAFTTYHLVPENSSYQVSIRSKVLKTGIDTNATWIIMTVRNYNCHFQKPR